jgi:cell division septation protein DedD
MAEKEKTAAAGAAAASEAQVNPSVELENKLAAAEKTIAAQKAELEDANEIIADLKDQLKNGGSQVLTVKVGERKFLVVGGFVKKGIAYTAKDIAANLKLAEELVNKGSGLLEPIN